MSNMAGLEKEIKKVTKSFSSSKGKKSGETKRAAAGSRRPQRSS